VACYRITSEALANVVKHARAREVVVAVTAARDELVLVVADDGVGLVHPSSGRGLGLASMRVRAEEIGGTCTVTATATGAQMRGTEMRGAEMRGTEVRARLPLRARP
jgi:signal transduction histidine kinase